MSSWPLVAAWQRRAIATFEVPGVQGLYDTTAIGPLSSDVLVLATSAMLSSTVHSDDGCGSHHLRFVDDRLFSWEGERFSRNTGWLLFLQGWTA